MSIDRPAARSRSGALRSECGPCRPTPCRRATSQRSGARSSTVTRASTCRTRSRAGHCSAGNAGWSAAG